MSYLSLTILSFFLISCSINTAKFNYRTIVINIPCLEWNLEFDRKDFIEISNSKINIDYCWAGFRAYDKNTNINISVHIIKPDSDYFYYTNFIEYIEFELSNERTGLHYNYQEALKNNIIKTRHYKDFFIAEYILESYRYVYVYQMHYKIFFEKDGVMMNIQLSKKNFNELDRKYFDDFIESLRIVEKN